MVYPVDVVLFFVNNQKYLCECLLYSNETWYQNEPLDHLSVCQISKHSNNQFLEVISQKHLVQFSWNLKSWVLTMGSISTPKIIRFHISSRKLHMHKNCVIDLPAHMCGAPASWTAQHTTVCFDQVTRWVPTLIGSGQDGGFKFKREKRRDVLGIVISYSSL